MQKPSRTRNLALALSACSLAACSSSSSDSPTVTLSATDAATDDLSTFVIGIESVELQRAVGGPVSILQLPVAVDFTALSDLSRVLNVQAIPEDTYTGVEVVLLFDNDRVHLNGVSSPATLLDSDGATLTGTLTLDIDFPVPLVAEANNYEIELDLDLNQSLVVDSGGNQVFLEPTLIPRINPGFLKEHAIGGTLRTVLLADSFFRIALDAQVGAQPPVVRVDTGPGTVFQIDGECRVGAAGLSALDNMPPGTWVQAFGSVQTGSSSFQAAAVEAGTGSYNGGTDIVEGLITGISGSVFSVRGHSNDSAHTAFQFNLNYEVSTSQATKVVRRGSDFQFPDTDHLNVGQHVRIFGGLTINQPPPHAMDVTLPTDVIRKQLTLISGIANAAPAGNMLSVDVSRVGLRDVGDFTWSEGGATPADPDAMMFDVGNLATGQGITNGTPVLLTGFFSSQTDAGADFVATTVANRDRLPYLCVIRDRLNGLTVSPTVMTNQIDFAFAGASAGFEKAAIDQGFQGEIDLEASGVSVVPSLPGGLGVYTIRDRTLGTFSLYFTFSEFTQGLQTASMGGATIFNFGSVGLYDAGTDTVTTALTGVVVQ